MSKISIKNLSLKFRTYNDRSPSLKDYLENTIRCNSKPYHAEFSAINNLTVDINAGDRVGIIGHNGAGKSTILKAICKIYEPFHGSITVDGRIAPLLEIGAGFHPEFTGRENIYLNGAILGYSKQELRELEPDVIAFSELEEFIDTPVKYYSTGMYMRLAFSLATAMHPDILILDEIFAGGDASFLGKATNRLYSLIDKANILLMVSHDLNLVERICNRVLLMDHGYLIADGEPHEIIPNYLKKYS